ncbi:MAG: YggU family protein [Ferrovum sp.]|nr:YggU family protein [Ferrovum sp.]
MSACYSIEARTGALLLHLHVQPGASRTEIVGLHGDALKIRLAAPPVEGRANEVLLRYLADLFEVPLRQVALRAGATGRKKRVAIQGSAVEIHSILLSIR